MTTHPAPTERDALREALGAAYIQGATDVHEFWQPPDDPDFGEAASDYVASLDLAALTTVDEDEFYEIGNRDGYARAVQDIDLMTGGDGEYFASTVPGRGCPDPAAMKARIAERFVTTTVDDTVAAETERCADGWKPIASAPKDGTIIDVWVAAHREANVWWNRHEGYWYRRENRSAVIFGYPVTHWRPLPSSPAIRAKVTDKPELSSDEKRRRAITEDMRRRTDRAMFDRLKRREDR